jgi:hypothetical protein
MISSSWIHAIQHTPIWVWALFAYIFWVGIQALHTQKVYPPSMLIIPAIMAAFKFPIFFEKAPYLYMGSFFLGGGLGLLSSATIKIQWSRYPTRLILPGGHSTLISLVSFFSFKYIYALWMVVNHELASEWAWLDIGISGLFPGYNWAKGLFFTQLFFRHHKN